MSRLERDFLYQTIDRLNKSRSIETILTLEKLMRFWIVAIVLNLLPIALPADACRSRDSEYSIFFEKMPVSKLKTEVFVKVDLQDVKDGIASARIVQVLKAPSGSIRQGDQVLLKYDFSSCGPNHNVGEKGTIFAKLSIDNKGQRTLYPYLRRYGDGRIFPPRI
jgi:hypothetical protein